MSESDLGPTEDGTVVLDIGGDIGALILYTPQALLRAEIEISPLDETAADVFQLEHPHEPDPEQAQPHEHGDGHTHTHAEGAPHRTHVAVRERRGPAGVRYAAVYPGLREGVYQLWGVDGQPADTVRITGGEVAQLDWR